jgi:hypothetical protein
VFTGDERGGVGIMVDEELVRQRHDVSGSGSADCELCGQPAAERRLIRLAGRPGASEPVEELRVCDACYLRVEADDVPFDEEVGAGLRAVDE